LRLKRFKGRRVPEVVRQVRRELGPEAVILHTRPLARRGLLRFLGGAGVEVVAAADEHVRRPAPRPAPRPVLPVLPPLPEPRPELRSAVDELRDLFVKVGGTSALHPAVAPLHERLVAAGLERTLAFRIVSALPVFGGDGGVMASAQLAQALHRSLAAMIAVAPAPATPRHAVQVFVGPPGAGKTTTLAKLAVRGQLAAMTTRMLSVDASGLAAGASLEALARVLGLSFTLVSTPDELRRQALGGPGSGLTLVDTPGVAPTDTKGIVALSRWLSALRPAETHLVLSATTKTDDTRAAVAAFTPLGITHLVFTRLDETTSVGSLLELAITTHLPLAHFGTGRDVPNDLRPASADELLRRVLEGEPAR
jgi:flagellar biosynthesis protein FlhF